MSDSVKQAADCIATKGINWHRSAWILLDAKLSIVANHSLCVLGAMGGFNTFAASNPANVAKMDSLIEKLHTKWVGLSESINSRPQKSHGSQQLKHFTNFLANVEPGTVFAELSEHLNPRPGSGLNRPAITQSMFPIYNIISGALKLRRSKVFGSERIVSGISDKLNESITAWIPAKDPSQGASQPFPARLDETLPPKNLVYILLCDKLHPIDHEGLLKLVKDTPLKKGKKVRLNLSLGFLLIC